MQNINISKYYIKEMFPFRASLGNKDVSDIYFRDITEMSYLQCGRIKLEVCMLTIIMKNCIFWDVTPCGSCKNRRLGGT
jgi:hypothetical protein